MFQQIKIGDVVAFIHNGNSEQFIVKDAFMPEGDIYYKYRIGKPFEDMSDIMWIDYAELQLVC